MTRTPSTPDGHAGVGRIFRATGHSLSGLRLAYRYEAAFKQEVWLTAVLVPASFWLGRSPLEIGLLVGAVLQVLIVELLNSAVEAVVDRVSPEWHELSKRAKDIASAAVMLSLALWATVWLAVIAQHGLLAR
jgi:diacylglycerol kinase (ATP)